MKLEPHDSDYPDNLCKLEVPPILTASGPLDAPRIFAIAGSRSAPDEACEWVWLLAKALGEAGIVVISGGAVGVDRAAHEGALAGGGATWLVSPCGKDFVYPRSNRGLLRRMLATERSRVLWPFADDVPVDAETFRYRNGVLVALAECVIIVRAAERSGSRNTARWARRLRKKLYVVPGPPWDSSYDGTTQELIEGAVPLLSIHEFLIENGLPAPRLPPKTSPKVAATSAARRDRKSLEPPRRRAHAVRPLTFSDPPRKEVDRGAWTEDESAVFSVLSPAPTQQDAIIVRAGLSASATLTALLTLSLKDVVVEGPDGFFRSRVNV